MTILITGFDPFGGESENPSSAAVSLLPGEISGERIEKRTIPTEFLRSIEVLDAAISEIGPDAVICTGQAEGRGKISLERVAINIQDARIPDNAGNQPRDAAMYPTGPEAYFSNLPLRAMEEAIRAKGIPAHLSYSAGTFVCNSVFYHLRHIHGGLASGFIHLPYSSSQAAEKSAHVPFMSVHMMAAGLEAAIRTLIEDLRDSSALRGDAAQ